MIIFRGQPLGEGPVLSLGWTTFFGDGGGGCLFLRNFLRISSKAREFDTRFPVRFVKLFDF